MKIDKQKLIELLVENTGLEPDAVESQLEQLITKIREAAEKGKALEIKSFGMFYYSQQGDLKFDPSEDLETEVNHKYAGMEPVEIKKPESTVDDPLTRDPKPTDETTDGEEIDTDRKPAADWKEDEDGDFKKTAETDETAPSDAPEIPLKASEEKKKEKPEDEIKAEEDDAPDKQEKPADEDSVLAKKDEEKSNEKTDDEEKEAGDQDDFNPFSELGRILGDPDMADPQSEKEKALEREESIKSLFPELPEQEKKKKEKESKLKDEQKSKKQDRKPDTDIPGKKDTSVKTDSGKKPLEKSKSKKKSPKKKEKSPVTMILVSIVAALVLIVGVIVAMDTGLFGDSDTADDVAQFETDPPGAAAEPDPGDALEDEPEENGETELDPAEPEETGIEEETEEDSLYGLTGNSREIDANYYSIILHSMSSESNAQNMQEQLQQEGYRTVIASVSTEGQGTMWRVGIGQFPTIPEAQEAAGELPQNYRENNFIGLIQQ